jgi:ligand-binding sensor domain-containing protein
VAHGVVRLAGVLALFAVTASAQQYHFAVLEPEDGLPAAAVYAVDQDASGYLWIATSEGLARYDGAEFRVFDVSTGLQEQRIYSMARDRTGAMWLGTEQGVSRYDGYGVRSFTFRDGLGRGTIWDLAIDAHENVWLATHAGGLSVRVGDGFRTYTTEDGLPSNSVYSVLVDDLGRLWVGFADGGLLLAGISAAGDLEIVRVWTEREVPGLEAVRAVAQEPDSRRMIVATRAHGLLFVEPDLEFVRPDVRLGTGDVYALAFGDSGRLIVGTGDAGVRICAPPDYGRCSTLDRGNGLPSDEILTVFEDREGTLWIGSGLGLYRWSGAQFMTYTEKEGLHSDRVLGVSAESDGTVWISTTDGATRLDPDAVLSTSLQSRTYTIDDGLPSNEVWQTLRDRQGDLWFATAGGLCLFREGRSCRTFSTDDGLPGSYVLTLFQADDDAVWVGSTGGAARIVRSDDGTMRVDPFTASEGLAGTDVYAVDQGADGRIWLACAGGVSMYDGRSFRSWTPDDGLGVATINDILVSRTGRVWVATSGAGLARYEPSSDGAESKAFRTWGRNEGLPSSTVISIVEDEAGFLWMGTLQGIVQIDPGRIDEGEDFVLSHLVSSDGLGSQDPGSGNALALGKSGDLWFGLAKGATRYVPDAPSVPDVPPVVSVETIRVGAERVFSARFSNMSPDGLAPADKTVEIPVTMRDLEIEYRGISLRHQKDVRYQTWLDGYEAGWSQVTKRASREFTNLPPGDYTFRVRAKLDGGSWSVPAGVAIEIPPVFWERIWFRFLAVALIAGAIVAFHRMRLFAIRERNEQLNRLVAARTADLEERTHDLEQANVELRENKRQLERFVDAIRMRVRPVPGGTTRPSPGKGSHDTHRALDPVFTALTEVLPGTVLDKRYRLDSLIGSGGFGSVYRGTHLVLDRPIAVKVLQPPRGHEAEEQLEQFRAEAMSAYRFDHPNAVSVLDASVSSSGLPYIVMELLEGQSLRDLIEKSGSLSVKRCAEVVVPVCDVMARAHRIGLVHKDLKPDNIFISVKGETETVKVLDFGLARFHPQSDDASEEVNRQVFGTPVYMSPEAFAGGEKDPDKTDVYAISVVTFEALAGRPPFVPPPGGDSWSLVTEHATAERPRLREFVPDAPVLLENLLLAGLEKEPDLRPTMRAFAEQLIIATLTDDEPESDEDRATLRLKPLDDE